MRIEFESRWHAARAHAAKAMTGAAALSMAAALMLGAAGCSGASDASSASEQSASAESTASGEGSAEDAASYGTTIDESLYDLEYTDRDNDPAYDEGSATKITLAGASATVEGDGAAADGSTVTVVEEGVYVLEGQLDDGQLVVNAPEDAKVQLVLADASIANQDGAAIDVEQADKCFITLADGTSNALSDGGSYASGDDGDEVDAALFSTCDLTLQGSGALSVSGNCNDAVKTKDDLVITGGTYDVAAKGDGLVGKDSVKIAAGDVTVETAEGDAVKASKDDSENKGFVSIDGGTLSLNAADKGIKAATYLRVAGGELNVTAADDALHSDGSGRILGGELEISAADDAVHVEYELQVDDGIIDVVKCYEGLEGQTITVNGGDTSIVASDDGVNASTPGSGGDTAGAVMSGDGNAHWSMPEGSDGGDVAQPPDGAEPGQAPQGATGGEAPSGAPSEQGSNGSAPPELPSGEAPDASGEPGDAQFGGRGQMGGGMMDADESCVLTVNGGTLVVDAQGDGLDSNGSIVMNGGAVYVSGPTSDGDGALDCGTSIIANGGTLIAVGSSGMAEGFTEGVQPFAQASFEGAADEELQVSDPEGVVIASFTPTKSYQSVVVTAPAFQEGSQYTISAGAETASVTASTTAASSGAMGGQMGGMQNGPGGKGGRGGQMPGAGRSSSSAVQA